MREDYTPFGETRQNPAANANEESFTGHIRDTATGLTYMQARYYDPVIGRFLSNDPVGFAEGGWSHFNRYVYAESNPINLIDPNGRDAVALTFDVDLFVPVPVGPLLVPVGGGVSGGIVLGFDFKTPELGRLPERLIQNRGNPGVAVMQTFTEPNEAGLIGNVRLGAGLDASAGLALEYTPGSVSDLTGTSTQLEFGAGPLARSVSALDGSESLVPNNVTGGSAALEVGASLLPVSGSLSRERTGAWTVSRSTDRNSVIQTGSNLHRDPEG